MVWTFLGGERDDHPQNDPSIFTPRGKLNRSGVIQPSVGKVVIQLSLGTFDLS